MALSITQKATTGAAARAPANPMRNPAKCFVVVKAGSSTAGSSAADVTRDLQQNNTNPVPNSDVSQTNVPKKSVGTFTKFSYDFDAKRDSARSMDDASQ
jgi:hypothetical protein